MSIDKYKTFVVAARYGTFHDAADELYITASAVSKHIAALEKELGIVLFERLPQGVRLTKAGEARLPLAKRIVEAHDELKAMKVTSPDLRLQLYSIPTQKRFGLSQILAEFRTLRPEIVIEISERHGLALAKAILDGECELGFAGSQYLNPGLLQWITITKGKVGAVLPLCHPLASCESISLKCLSGDDFVFLIPETGMYQVYVEFCKRNGFIPKVKTFASREDTLIYYVANNMGVSLSQKEMVDIYKNDDDIVFVPLDEELCSSSVLVRARHRNLSPAGSIFWNFIKKKFE
ncbi:MAG: LysR family transcriptional regulator [Peptococcaceae bacterium]|nr:LysR family transcriptional regulator [Peptococcaceae bacterium]